jgi:uncharacterized protein (TIGR00369 family)
MNLLREIGPDLSGIEQLRIMRETAKRPGMAETLDIRLVEVDEGRAVFEATPGIHVYNPLGVAHGGFAATVLDFACGYAVLSKLRAGQGFTTLEIKIAYHRAMTSDTGVIRCEGKVVQMGRRAAFTEARLTNTNGDLLASATSSLLIMA